MPLRLTRLARRAAALASAATLLGLCIASAAPGADSVYWFNNAEATISHANLAGGGGADFPIPGGPGNLTGIAIDASAGRIYWGRAGSIEFASLDGSGVGKLNTTGALIREPSGLAIDPAARRLYWANRGQTSIAFANLDGSGGGSLSATGATPPDQATGVIVHRASGRLYWTDTNKEVISFANLDGSGGGDLEIPNALLFEPFGLVIDSADGRLYWANSTDNSIGSASLAGGQETELAISGVDTPTGLALDRAAGRIYWSSFNAPTISVAPFPGGGSASPLDVTGAATPSVASLLPILLKAPSLDRDRPVPQRAKPMLGYQLSCEDVWVGDQVEANLMQAPQTVVHQWLRDGAPVAGATGPTIIADKPGTYLCRSTASNFAGSTTVVGDPFPVEGTLKKPANLELKKLVLRRGKGTATLFVEVPGAGRLQLTGAGVKPVMRMVRSAGTVKLPIRASGKAKRKLLKTGSARVKARIAFFPNGGSAQRATKTIVLKKP